MLRKQSVDAFGGPIEYFESGAGWPVILLHAFPLNAEMWRPQLERVPVGWRFIAPDMRRFGTSRVHAGEPGMTDYAKGVLALLDALGMDRAVIGGLSMGGYITFELFRRAPERLNAVVLADTRAQADTPDGRQARRTMSELVRTKGASAVADQMLPKLLGEKILRGHHELVAHVRQLIDTSEVGEIDAAIQAMMTRPDSTPDLARISLPTLVIVGAEDAVTPIADAELLHRQIPRSQLVVLPGAAHLSNLEAPDEFSAALENFLASNL
jgi:3-oxoadipate enol-lactonase